MLLSDDPDPSEPEETLRHMPKQERGRQRVNKILDAASQVLAEVGYEAATTILIAERAETSVGSLYQFFKNKEQIVRALVDRYVAQASVMFDAVPIEAFTTMTIEEMTDHFVDPLREFVRDNYDFHVIFASSLAFGYLGETIRVMDEGLIRRTDAIFALRRPDLTPRERRKYSLVSMTIVKALMGLAHISQEYSLDEVFDEMKALSNRYLKPIMGEALPK